MAARNFDAYRATTLLQSFDHYEEQGKAHHKSLKKLSPHQRKSLHRIFRNVQMNEGTLDLDSKRKNEEQRFREKVEQAELRILELLEDPQATQKPYLEVEVEQLWRQFYKTVTSYPTTLSKESIREVQNALQRIWDVASQKKFDNHFSKKLIKEGLIDLNAKLHDKEGRCLLEVKVSQLRTALWQEYQKELLNSSPREARAFLKVGLQTLQELTLQQTKAFTRTIEKFSKTLIAAQEQKIVLDWYELAQLLSQEGLDAEIVSLLLPVCKEMIKGHNETCRVHEEAQYSGEKMAAALLGTSHRFQGNIHAIRSEPILAVTLVFTDLEDYNNVYNHLLGKKRDPADVREAGVCLNRSAKFSFGTMNLTAPVTLISPLGQYSVTHIKDHEDSHHSMLSDHLGGELNRTLDETPIVFRFSTENIDPAFIFLHRTWRTELQSRAQRATLSLHNEVQAYLPDILTDPRRIINSLTNFSKKGLYNYIFDDEFEEYFRKHIASKNLSSEQKTKAFQLLMQDIETAKKQYVEAVVGHVETALRIARALKSHVIPRDVIQTFLRTATMREWPYLARYLDAPRVCLRGTTPEAQQAWDTWKQNNSAQP